MIIIDREGKTHKINCMRIKDVLDLKMEVAKACTVLGIKNIDTYLPDIECTTEEGWQSVDRLLPYLFANSSAIDLVMLKQALVWFMGINKRYDRLRPYILQTELSYKDKLTMQINLCNLLEQRTKELKDLTPEQQEEQKELIKFTINAAKKSGILEDDSMVLEKLEVGTIITDRNGVERKVYSMLLKDRTKVFDELLPKIDGVITANNTTEQSYNALLKIVRMALDDDTLTNEDIESFMDAEFAKKTIRVFMDMPM